jgi:hypothetical protein
LCLLAVISADSAARQTSGRSPPSPDDRTNRDLLPLRSKIIVLANATESIITDVTNLEEVLDIIKANSEI